MTEVLLPQCSSCVAVDKLTAGKLELCGVIDELKANDALAEEIDEFCNSAWEAWGERSQITMCVEECGELITELCKYLNSRGNRDEVLQKIGGELADVLITSRALAINLLGEEVFNEHLRRKLGRAKTHLLPQQES